MYDIGKINEKIKFTFFNILTSVFKLFFMNFRLIITTTYYCNISRSITLPIDMWGLGSAFHTKQKIEW